MSNLRKIRETMKVSGRFGRKGWVYSGAIGHYESGRRHPDLRMCRQLVEALNSFGANVQLDDVFPPELNAA